MHASNHLGVGELPHVNVMAAENAGERLDVLTDLLDADVIRCCLEEHPRRSTSQGYRRLEDDGSDEQRHGWIGVELARPVRKPDDERCDNYTDIAQCITNHVQHHGVHPHVAMTVTMATRRCLFGQRMVMAGMCTRVPPRSLSHRGPDTGVTVKRAVLRFRITEQRRLLVGTLRSVVQFGIVIRIPVAVASRLSARRGGCHAVGNDVLSEAGWVDAHVLDAGQSRMSTLTGATLASSPGLERCSSGIGLVPAGRLIAAKPYVAAGFRCVGLGLLSKIGQIGRWSSNCDLWDGTSGRGGFIGPLAICAIVISGNVMFLVMSVCMGMVMIAMVVFVVVIMVIVASMRVTVATKDEETNEVGE